MDDSAGFLSNSFKIIIIHIGILLQGGSGLLLIINYSSGSSKNSGLIVSFGITSAALILIVLSCSGILSLVSNNHIAFQIVKYLCSLYLIYIATSSLIRKSGAMEVVNPGKSNGISSYAFFDGLFSTLLNPHAIMYFLLVFSKIVLTEKRSFYVFLYSCEIVLITFVWFTILSICFSNSKVRALYFRHIKPFQIVFSVLLIVMALMILGSKG